MPIVVVLACAAAAATSTWNTTYHLPFCRVRIAICRLTRQRTVPADLDLARHADETQAPALADRKAVADAHLSSVIASLGAETREAILTALDAAEERLECPIETPQDLLLALNDQRARSAHSARTVRNSAACMP